MIHMLKDYLYCLPSIVKCEGGSEATLETTGRRQFARVVSHSWGLISSQATTFRALRLKSGGFFRLSIKA